MALCVAMCGYGAMWLCGAMLTLWRYVAMAIGYGYVGAMALFGSIDYGAMAMALLRCL